MEVKPPEIAQSLSGSAEKQKSNPLRSLRTTIMAGLTVIAPLWITGWVILTLFEWADSFSAPLVKPIALRLGYTDGNIPGLGLALTFAILWVVGIFTTNVVGKRLLQAGREALVRLPLVRTIYSPVQQLLETMTSPEKAGFKKVVLVEYPRKGLWTLGFLAGDVPQEDQIGFAHSIFVPTAPNPTTGFMLIVPPEQLRSTSLSVEAALKMIVSAGVVVPSSLTMPVDEPENSLDEAALRSSR